MSGGAQQIAGLGDSSPEGGVFESFQACSFLGNNRPIDVNSSGHVMFSAHYQLGPEIYHGVYVAYGGQVLRAIGMGDNAFGKNFQFTCPHSMNDRGEIVMSGMFEDRSGGTFIVCPDADGDGILDGADDQPLVAGQVQSSTCGPPSPPPGPLAVGGIIGLIESPQHPSMAEIATGTTGTIMGLNWYALRAGIVFLFVAVASGAKAGRLLGRWAGKKP